MPVFKKTLVNISKTKRDSIALAFTVKLTLLMNLTWQLS